jgi:hypothetical protein
MRELKELIDKSDLVIIFWDGSTPDISFFKDDQAIDPGAFLGLKKMQKLHNYMLGQFDITIIWTERLVKYTRRS